MEVVKNILNWLSGNSRNLNSAQKQEIHDLLVSLRSEMENELRSVRREQTHQFSDMMRNTRILTDQKYSDIERKVQVQNASLKTEISRATRALENRTDSLDDKLGNITKEYDEQLKILKGEIKNLKDGNELAEEKKKATDEKKEKENDIAVLADTLKTLLISLKEQQHPFSHPASSQPYPPYQYPNCMPGPSGYSHQSGPNMPPMHYQNYQGPPIPPPPMHTDPNQRQPHPMQTAPPSNFFGPNSWQHFPPSYNVNDSNPEGAFLCEKHRNRGEFFRGNNRSRGGRGRTFTPRFDARSNNKFQKHENFHRRNDDSNSNNEQSGESKFQQQKDSDVEESFVVVSKADVCGNYRGSSGNKNYRGRPFKKYHKYHSTPRGSTDGNDSDTSTTSTVSRVSAATVCLDKNKNAPTTSNVTSVFAATVCLNRNKNTRGKNYKWRFPRNEKSEQSNVSSGNEGEKKSHEKPVKRENFNDEKATANQNKKEAQSDELQKLQYPSKIEATQKGIDVRKPFDTPVMCLGKINTQPISKSANCLAEIYAFEDEYGACKVIRF